jgi:hypothetical protein
VRKFEQEQLGGGGLVIIHMHVLQVVMLELLPHINHHILRETAVFNCETETCEGPPKATITGPAAQQASPTFPHSTLSDALPSELQHTALEHAGEVWSCHLTSTQRRPPLHMHAHLCRRMLVHS